VYFLRFGRFDFVFAGRGTDREVGKEGQPRGGYRRGTHPVRRWRQPRITVFLPEASKDC